MNEKPDRNYYLFLNIESNSSEAQIKLAIRKMFKANHPDLFPGDPVKEEITRQCNEATRWLTTSLRRVHDEHYGESSKSKPRSDSNKDQRRSSDSNWKGPNPGRPNGERKKYRAKGDDLDLDVTISFAEAFLGCVMELNGVKFRVPPKIRDGNTVRLAGKGLKSPDGGPSGDLYVKVKVDPDRVFSYHLKSKDLCIKVPVTELEALVGINLSTHFFDGTSLEISIPPSSLSKSSWKVEGKPDPNSKIPSSYWIQISVAKLSGQSTQNIGGTTKRKFDELNSELFPNFHREDFRTN